MTREPIGIVDASSDRVTGVTGALHDVSNALTVLLGWVSEARVSSTPNDLEHALAMIDQRARVARDLARRAIGAAGPLESEAPVSAILVEVTGALAVEAQHAGVRIVSPEPGEALGVSVLSAGDAAHVLTNLLMNALAWSPSGGTVSVEAVVAEVHVTIDVQDVGPGIDDARAESVFGGESTRIGGAGVGLRHARAVARAIGGDLALVPARAPRHAGRGARFRLTWPRAGIVLPQGPLSNPRASVLAGKRVLVVEDDADVATLLEAALGARGAEVTVVRSIGELSRATASAHDAALIDLSPIAHDVEGAIALIRRNSPGVHLVFISGTAVGLPDALSEAHVRWVRKPFEVGEIVAALLDKPPSRD